MNKTFCIKCKRIIPDGKEVHVIWCDECWKKRVEEGYKNGKDAGD